MIQQPTLPVQQAAVQQQYAHGTQPTAPEFNAIKINIVGANVSAPAQQSAVCQQPMPAQPVSAQPEVGQNVNYVA